MLSTRFPASDPHHVHLAEEDPILIEKMVRFIYTFDYSAITTKGSIRADEVEPKSLPVHTYNVWLLRVRRACRDLWGRHFGEGVLGGG